MDATFLRNGDSLTAALSGRLDSTSTPTLETDVKSRLDGVKSLTVDCEKLEYISSAGLRLVIALCKTVPDFRLSKVGRDVMDVLEVTGLKDVLTIERQLRQISIDGLIPIASGLCGDCYRIDDETLLKLYREGTNPQWVEMEKAYAKAAFLMGVPTALSYDVVACGNRRGVLFELINSTTLASAAAHDLEHLEMYAKRFAQLGKSVHQQKGDPALLPDRMAYYESLLPKVDWLTPPEMAKLGSLMTSLPRADTCLHGDFHAGNVMLMGDELLFIDMGDFSIGHPMLDLSLVYNLYMRGDTEEMSLAVTKLKDQDRRRFFDAFLRAYYEGLSKDEYDEVILQLRRFACVRQIAYIIEFENTRELNIAFMRQVLSHEPDGK